LCFVENILKDLSALFCSLVPEGSVSSRSVGIGEGDLLNCLRGTENHNNGLEF